MMNRNAAPLEAETEADRLRFAITELQVDLKRHDSMLKRLQGEVAASRLEVAGARGETIQLRGMLGQAEAQAARAAALALTARHPDLDYLEAEIVQLRAVIAEREAEVLALQASIDLIRTSLSWRLSVPIRILGRLARGLTGWQLLPRLAIQKLRDLLRPKLPIAPLSEVVTVSHPLPTDPNARYAFKPNAITDDGTGVVTLNTLYHLSRSL